MMNIREFKRRAESAFLRANPTATIIGWIRKPADITYPTGLKGLSGSFGAIADGHRTSVMTAQWDAETGLAVR
jgi:hypothetical protein